MLTGRRRGKEARRPRADATSKCRRGERNFPMQRPDARIRRRDRIVRQRLGTLKIVRKIPAGTAFFRSTTVFAVRQNLGGGDYLDQTACSPRRHRTGLRYPSRERNFLLQRQGAELASFALNARAETALAEKIGRHVFEIAELQRVSLDQYNLSVWVVGWKGPNCESPRSHVEPVSREGARNGFFRCRDGS